MNEYNDNLHKNSKASTFENARALRKMQTNAESILWEALRNGKVCNLKFRRQHPFDGYILDFYNHRMKLAIEVDGEVHNNPDVADYDAVRTKNLNENGITVLRFTNDEVEQNLETVIKKIEAWFDENEFVKLDLATDETYRSIPEKNNDRKEAVGFYSPLSSRRGVGGEVNNRIEILFSQKKNNILNIYCTAGYPHLNSTLEVMMALQDSGADMIEIGIPYSDPLADGPVIQQSSSIAIANGMTIAKLFEQLEGFREKIHLPVILMGYMNPVMQYGFEKFCADAAAVGIDGLILPDLPVYEFETTYGAIIKKYGLDFIFLVTPETGDERIKKLDSLGTGFIYAVSSSATTGNNKGIEEQEAYFSKLKDMQLTNPVLVGFGIKDRAGFTAACKHTHGAIIGSAYINALKNSTDTSLVTKEFINAIRP